MRRFVWVPNTTFHQSDDRNDCATHTLSHTHTELSPALLRTRRCVIIITNTTITIATPGPTFMIKTRCHFHHPHHRCRLLRPCQLLPLLLLLLVIVAVVLIRCYRQSVMPTAAIRRYSHQADSHPTQNSPFCNTQHSSTRIATATTAATTKTITTTTTMANTTVAKH